MIIGHVVFKRLDVIDRTIQHNALALHVDTLPLNISTKQEVFISFLLLFFQFSDPESFFPKVLHFEKRHRREGRGAGTPRGRARRRAANRVCPASESAGQDRRVSEPVASPSTVTVTVVDTELRKTRLIPVRVRKRSLLPSRAPARNVCLLPVPAACRERLEGGSGGGGGGAGGGGGRGEGWEGPRGAVSLRPSGLDTPQASKSKHSKAGILGGAPSGRTRHRQDGWRARL